MKERIVQHIQSKEFLHLQFKTHCSYFDTLMREILPKKNIENLHNLIKFINKINTQVLLS